MKPIYLLLFGLLIYNIVFSQKMAQQNGSKPPVDLSMVDHWPTIANVQISNNGRYIFHIINCSSTGKSNLIVSDTAKRFRKEFTAEVFLSPLFTEDSKKIVVIKDKTLLLIDLSSGNVDSISNVSEFKTSTDRPTKWLAYKRDNALNTVVVRNLVTIEEKVFDDILDYSFLGHKLLLTESKTKNDGTASTTLNLLDLSNNGRKTIGNGIVPSNIMSDNGHNNLAFVGIEDRDNRRVKELCYYVQGMERVKCINVDSSLTTEGSGLELRYVQRFSNDGKRIFFSVKHAFRTETSSDETNALVWSYLDPMLPARQAKLIGKGQFTYAMEIENGRITRIQSENENVTLNGFGKLWNDEYLLVRSRGKGDQFEASWNNEVKDSVFLVSAKNGTRKLITVSRRQTNHQITPSGKFVIYYDADYKNYFSYEVASGKHRNITKTANGIWWSRNDEPRSSDWPLPFSILGFVIKDKVLIADQFDIYLVDPSGKENALSITKDFGRKNNIVFRLIKKSDEKVIEKDEELILSAFNLSNKNDGFYKTTINNSDTPILLTIDTCKYVGISEDSDQGIVFPYKAKDASVYLVNRSNASESPNYYYTTDFKSFFRVTDSYPEKFYNWVATELITWKTLDGIISQGILYKPEDFNPKKKYPVIFTYYERYSNGLHEYEQPLLSDGPLRPGTISYLVSNGYLVFVPDIHYTIGYPGRSAFNSVVSATEYLSKFPWIDSTKMGIQGHSFGGFETCYIVTHTSRFAAACAAAPMTNFISAYGSVIGDGSSRQRQYESGRDRIGANLWEQRHLYIENSPVLNVDSVNTPILIMANDKDGDVPWQQGIEFFTALRRLGKKSWMLQYKGQGHILADKESELDYTIRLRQFFDHYLKGAPAPKWMTRSFPLSEKGADELNLDTEIKTPGDGLLIQKR